MKKNLSAAIIMVMSIPSLALAGVATVPEPASMVLFGAGLVGVGIMKKVFKG
ncbi:MAG: PEP-CTERM sorting domain-containing protein [Nitrospirae bacterium]|nr:PEP-CTERM sorting domain-containing protein [Nitrospirota bacterium]